MNIPELQKDSLKLCMIEIINNINLISEKYLNSLDNLKVINNGDKTKSIKAKYYSFAASLLPPLRDIDSLCGKISKAICETDKENLTDKKVALNDLLTLCISARIEIQDFLSQTEELFSHHPPDTHESKLYALTKNLIRKLYYLKCQL